MRHEKCTTARQRANKPASQPASQPIGQQDNPPAGSCVALCVNTVGAALCHYHLPLLLEGFVLLEPTVQPQHLCTSQESCPLGVIFTLVEELQHPGLPGVIRQQVDEETGLLQLSSNAWA